MISTRWSRNPFRGCYSDQCLSQYLLRGEVKHGHQLAPAGCIHTRRTRHHEASPQPVVAISSIRDNFHRQSAHLASTRSALHHRARCAPQSVAWPRLPTPAAPSAVTPPCHSCRLSLCIVACSAPTASFCPPRCASSETSTSSLSLGRTERLTIPPTWCVTSRRTALSPQPRLHEPY